MARPKTVSEVPVAPKVSEPSESRIENLLQNLIDRIERVEQAVQRPITSQASEINENMNPVAPVPALPGLLPVPQDYRTLVDTLLNPQFGIELEAHVDAPVITTTIIVPDKYSTMTPTQREMLKRDIRPKVMTLAGGVAELREWVETVYRSFTPEMQSMITSERTT